MTTGIQIPQGQYFLSVLYIAVSQILEQCLAHIDAP